MRGQKQSLVVVPALAAVERSDGQVLITKKFVEGMTFYAEAWDGPVTALMAVVEKPTDNLDGVAVDPASLPFKLTLMRTIDPASVTKHLAGAGVVLGGPFWWLRDLSALCAEVNVPSVYNTEYSLTTRLQIVFANNANPVRLLRRSLWEVNEELGHYRPELGLADGVQCNGTPTFEAYRGLTPEPLLYFDTRVPDAELASDEQLGRANARRRQRKPLRLAFSGRLNATKGAGDLVKVAAELDRRRVPFQMDIYGGGALEGFLRSEVQRRGLPERVALKGVVDFHSQLMPILRDQIDLFVCCHPQGDPSCTYLETMSAGVPIVGYANEAFAGLVRQQPVGWTAPLSNPGRLADEIARLHADREALVAGAVAALDLARQHSFERTFRRRIDHLAAIAARGRRPRTPRAPKDGLPRISRSSPSSSRWAAAPTALARWS
ncbi:MAG TPA: glycosyltransferase [Polyangia bacterium]|jgi:glycosyltransferase involved in cell wall biosynthesis